MTTRSERAAQARESVRWYKKASELTPALKPYVACMEREAAHQESMGRIEAGLKTLKGYDHG